MSRERLWKSLMLLCLFLLPWQTHLLAGQIDIAGRDWEFGKMRIYAVELLVIITFCLRGRPVFQRLEIKRVIFGIFAAVFLSVTFSIRSDLAFFQLLHLASASALFLLLIDERIDRRQAIWALRLDS